MAVNLLWWTGVLVLVLVPLVLAGAALVLAVWAVVLLLGYSRAWEQTQERLLGTRASRKPPKKG
jgi:hypothetical protein